MLNSAVDPRGPRCSPTSTCLIHSTYRTDIAELGRRAGELAEYFPPAQALERWLRDYFIPAQEERGVASMLNDALVTAPHVFPESKEQFRAAVDALVRAAQASGEVRDDITTRDILRMAHGIAITSRGAPDTRGACSPSCSTDFDSRHKAPRAPGRGAGPPSNSANRTILTA